MRFFNRLAVKKQINELIEKAKIIYDETGKTLQPSRNVYYHYNFVNLQLTRCDQTVTMQEIQLSLITFDSYINQLVTIKSKFKELLESEPKLKTKFSKEYSLVKSYLVKLTHDVEILISNIHELPDYRNYNEFIIMLKYLEQHKNKLYFLNKKQEEQKELTNTVHAY